MKTKEISPTIKKKMKNINDNMYNKSISSWRMIHPFCKSLINKFHNTVIYDSASNELLSFFL